MSHHETHSVYRAWARQLQNEFADICYQYSLNLLPPVIEVTDSTKSLGSWRAATRTLCISSHLICHYSWDITINVLKHEMAHQICSELFLSQGLPHDGEFRRACDLLGLAAEFCKASIDYSALLSEDLPANQEQDRRKKLLAKIGKVLAMADSANEHEALAALRMAGRIIEKHNLDGLADAGIQEITYRIVRTGKKRIDSPQRTIASILSRYFQVTLIRSQLYDPAADAVYKTFEIFGRREDVEVAEHCFHFLESRLTCLWRMNRKNFANIGGSAKKSYYLGVLQGFSEKLTVKSARTKPGDRPEKPCRLPALSVHQLSCDHEVRVRQCIQRRHPRLRTLKTVRQIVSGDIYHQGREAGRGIVLSKALQQEQETSIPKYLTTGTK